MTTTENVPQTADAREVEQAPWWRKPRGHWMYSTAQIADALEELAAHLRTAGDVPLPRISLTVGMQAARMRPSAPRSVGAAERIAAVDLLALATGSPEPVLEADIGHYRADGNSGLSIYSAVADPEPAEEPSPAGVVACTWWHYGAAAHRNGLPEPVQCGKPAGHHKDHNADAQWMLHADPFGSEQGPWFAATPATEEPERTLTAAEDDAAKRVDQYVGEPKLPQWTTRDAGAPGGPAAVEPEPDVLPPGVQLYDATVEDAHLHGYTFRPGLGWMPDDENCPGCCEIATVAANLGIAPLPPLPPKWSETRGAEPSTDTEQVSAALDAKVAEAASDGETGGAL